jgi:hypothetical protein
VPERWLLALLHGSRVVQPNGSALEYGEDAVFVLAGSLSLRAGGEEQYPLQRGDLFHRTLVPKMKQPELLSTAKWTRVLLVPHALYEAFLKDTGLGERLARLYRTRCWWRLLTEEELGLDTLVALSLLCRERRYKAGANVVRQGDPANHFYIVTDGCVEVLRENGSTRVIGAFRAGYHFGEIALLGQEVRTATVRASEPTQALELPARAFRRHLMDIPLARYRLCQIATRRKSELMRTRPNPDGE